MKFQSEEDIEAPIAKVFEAIADFEHMERAAVRRGIEVERSGAAADPQAGLAWDLRFQLRGTPRDVHLVLKEYNPVTGLQLTGSGSGVEGTMQVTLTALSPRSTRMAVELQLGATSLPGRLMLQTLKITRGKIAGRFKERISDYAKATEARLNRTV